MEIDERYREEKATQVGDRKRKLGKTSQVGRVSLCVCVDALCPFFLF